MLTIKRWNLRSDHAKSEMLEVIKQGIPRTLQTHTIWSAHGGILVQVGKMKDREKPWRPSVLYGKREGGKIFTLYTIQIDEELPMVLTGTLPGQLTQWLGCEELIGSFRTWCEAEIGLDVYKDLWVIFASGVLSKLLIKSPSGFADLLSEWASTGEMFEPMKSPEGQRYKRIDAFREIRRSFEGSREWMRLSRDARLGVLTAVGTEFARRWSGWDTTKKKG